MKKSIAPSPLLPLEPQTIALDFEEANTLLRMNEERLGIDATIAAMFREVARLNAEIEHRQSIWWKAVLKRYLGISAVELDSHELIAKAGRDHIVIEKKK